MQHMLYNIFKWDVILRRKAMSRSKLNGIVDGHNFIKYNSWAIQMTLQATIFTVKIFFYLVWAPEPILYKKINTDFLKLSSNIYICEHVNSHKTKKMNA